MDEARLRTVGRRQVIHIGGFDPVEPDRLNHRLLSGLGKFGPLWNVAATASAPELSADGRVMTWRVETTGPNWSTETRYTVLRWDDLIAPYMAKPWWRKMIDGYAALFHFLVSGTIWRYFVANPRYGMFVLYPFLLLIAFAALSVLTAGAIAGTDLPLAALAGIVVGIGLFVFLLRWAGSFFHLYFALADWCFAAELVKGKAEGLSQCLDQFADEVVARVGEARDDEIVLSGVSFGAVMMAEALARALTRDPDLCRRGPAVAFLTIGSSILKIGLHPGAVDLKAAVSRVAREPSLFWIEYQSKVDPINFFKTDPVAMMGLPPTGKPIVKTMRLRETMTPEEYRFLKVNFLRLHRQFAMPNSRRYHYDFYLICFGPMPLAERVLLGEKAAAAIGEDGSYRGVQPSARDRARMAAAQ
jgi:hypothetical protein